MNTYNISAMIEFAYRHSGGDNDIVAQCEAALEELSVLIKAAQQSGQADVANACHCGDDLFAVNPDGNCAWCKSPRN